MFDPVNCARHHRRSQYEANRGTRLGKILPNTVDFYFFIRLIILEDFIRLISYNGPCVRLGCSFFLATALDMRYILTLRSLYGYQMLSSDAKSRQDLSLIALGKCPFPTKTSEIHGA